MMRLATGLTLGLLLTAPAWAQATLEQPPPAAGAAATPVTPEGATAHSPPGPAAAPAQTEVPEERPADIVQAVDCATLSQQFGDTLTALTLPTAAKKLDEAVKTTASDQAGAGRKACMEHDYAAGMDQLRQALGTLGKTPIL